MASIYEKALKRKDFSGITKKDKEEVASKDSKSGFFPESASLFSFTFGRENQGPEEGGKRQGCES